MLNALPKWLLWFSYATIIPINESPRIRPTRQRPTALQPCSAVYSNCLPHEYGAQHGRGRLALRNIPSIPTGTQGSRLPGIPQTSSSA
ncbi:ORF R U5 [Macacine gammaherpesvirus 5]|uniref:ORFRU5-R n=1 Tax=Rhesus monkey rhadinovirus H26-95 TaxID=69256 RepID=Q9J2H9_9GAMA|nr:ORFRU5-R [Rhesus monkey rhadinovirus H26-95]QFN51658.1 ORF R U5 [Macacine gammaherpesvirus 5]